jgi:hypothetical protein
MNKEQLREEVSGLIEKIRMDWARIKKSSQEFHRIDKDIIIDDIRRLYDLIYEVDLGKTETENRKMPDPVPVNEIVVDEAEIQGVVNSNPEQSETGSSGSFQDSMEDKISSDAGTGEEEQFRFKQQIVENIEFEVVNSSKELELTDQKESVAPKSGQKDIKDTPSVSKHQPKNTLDLFTATKTIADVFQNGMDNSVAARMQHNPIKDIKTAIGINDKFLFINTIFRGEISAYNKAIDRLNLLPDYYLALHFIDELKTDYGKEDNVVSFAKLMDIVKRKYL